MKEKRRHVLATLREIIGMKQTAFAALVTVSPATIQSIELNNGRLNLSESLAQRIAMETGVDVGWLLRNNPAEPMITENGKPFTKQHFDYMQSRLRGPKIEPEHFEFAQRRLLNYLELVSALMILAHRTDKMGLACYKLDSAIKSIWSEIAEGCNEAQLDKQITAKLPHEIISMMRRGMCEAASNLFDLFNVSMMSEFMEKNRIGPGKEVWIECLGFRIQIKGTAQTHKCETEGSNISVTFPKPSEPRSRPRSAESKTKPSRPPR